MAKNSGAAEFEDDLAFELRLAHQKALAEAPDAKLGHQIGYLRMLSNLEPEEAYNELDKLRRDHPENTNILVAMAELVISKGDVKATRRYLQDIAVLDGPRPVWVDRMIEIEKSGEVDQPNFKLRINQEASHPLILKHLAIGNYENREARIVSSYVRPGDKILELGAGIGFIALSTLSAQKDVSYRAVEANPALIPLINENREANGFDFEVVNAIYGTENGMQAFNVSRRFWSSSVFNVDNLREAIKVPCFDINDVLKEFPANFLVLDIEGFEYRVLNHIDLSGIDRIVVEFHPVKVSDKRHTNVVRRLLKAGFLIDMAASTHLVHAYYKP